MLFDSYKELIQIMVVIVSVSIAIALVYSVLVSGADPLVVNQSGAYDITVNACADKVISIVNDPNMF